MYLLYLFAWRLIGFFPENLAYSLANLISDRIYKKNGKGIKRLRSNYRRVKPHISEVELEQLTKLGMRSYMRYWFDTFRLNKWSKARIIETTKVNNEHLLRKFLDYRQSIGIEAISHKEKSIPILTQRLEAGKLVALIADRDMSRSGIEVEFLGGVAKMPQGPAILSLKTGAPLITAYIDYLPSGIEIFFDETIAIPTSGSETEKIKKMTQSIADNFAHRIEKNPVDWHMLQRIWIDEEN